MESEKEKKESKDQTDKSTQPGTAHTNTFITGWCLQYLKNQWNIRQNQLILNKEIPKGPEPTKPKNQDERRIFQYQQFFGSVTIPEYYNVKMEPNYPLMRRSQMWKDKNENASPNPPDESREKESFQHQLYSSGIEIIRSQNDVIRQSQERGKVVLEKAFGVLCTHYLYISGFKLALETQFAEHNIPELNKEYIISKGSFGECYRIKNKDGEQECLKVIKFEDKDHKYSDIRFTIREVGICKLLGIYQIGPKLKSSKGLDLLVYEDAMCYTMEKCQSLEQKIGEFDDKDMEVLIQKIEFDLKEALLKMHSLKLVHRDIKPSNILFSRESNKFIFCDYGLTHSVQQTYTQKTYVRELGGTKKYMMKQMWDLLESSKNNKRIDQKDRFVNLYYNDVVCLQRTIQFIRENFQNIQKSHDKSEGSKITFAHQYLNDKDSSANMTLKRILNIYKCIFGPSIQTQQRYQQFILKECPVEQRDKEKQHYQKFLEHFNHRYYEQQLTKLESITSHAGTIRNREIIQQGRYFVFKVLKDKKSPLLVRLKGFKYMSGCKSQQLEQLLTLIQKISSEDNLSSVQIRFLEIFQKIFARKYQIESKRMFKEEATLLQQSIDVHQQFIKRFSDDPDIVCLSQTLMCFLVDLAHPQSMNSYSIRLLTSKKKDFLSLMVKAVEIHMNLLKERDIYQRLETLIVYCTVIKKLLPLYHTNQEQLMKLLKSIGIVLQNFCRSDPKTLKSPYPLIIFFYSVMLLRPDQKYNEELVIINQFLFQGLQEHFGLSNYYIFQIYQNMAEYYHFKKDYKRAVEMKQLAYQQTFKLIGNVQIRALMEINSRYKSFSQLFKWIERILNCVMKRNKEQFISLVVSLSYELNEPYRVKEYPTKYESKVGLARQIYIQSHPIFSPFEIKPFNVVQETLKQTIRDNKKQFQKIQHVIVSYQVVMLELQVIVDSVLENLIGIQLFLEFQGDNLKELKGIRDFERTIEDRMIWIESMRQLLREAFKNDDNFFQYIEIVKVVKILEAVYEFVLQGKGFPELYRQVEKSVEEMKGKYLRWKEVLKAYLQGEKESRGKVEL